MAAHNFGDFLKKIRIQRGYKTQKSFSEVSGISQTTLSRIEAGTQRPLPETLMIIAEHLKPYTYGELMERAGYFEGLPSEDKNFVIDLFDETERMEIEYKINKLIDSISTGDKFTSTALDILKLELKPLIEAEGWTDIDYTPDDIKQLVKELDSNLEYKQMVLDILLRTKNLILQIENDKRDKLILDRNEQLLISKYRKLDNIGKYTVDTTLEAQYKRCTQPTQELRAAHMDDTSEEQQNLLKQDLDEL